MRRSAWVIVVLAVALAVVIGIAIGRHNSAESAPSTPATSDNNTGTVPRLSIAPSTTPMDTATCNGVTFPWTTSPPTCGTFGKPVTVSGIQATASDLRVVSDATTGSSVCVSATVTNKSGASTFDYGSWSLDSVSPQGAFHIIENSPSDFNDADLGHGQLVRGGRASGNVCFIAEPSEYVGHVLLTWLAPGNSIKAAVWVAAPPT